MKALLFSALALGSALAVFACGDDDDNGGSTATDAGVDAGSTPDTGTSADAGSDGNTTPQVVGECTDALFDQPASVANGGGDFTGFAGADISFPTTFAAAQYQNRCVKVKVGSKVNFAGDFSFHPLVPSGGDTPSPITATSSGMALQVTLTTAGTFGFHCSAHPTIMFGAIRVVP